MKEICTTRLRRELALLMGFVMAATCVQAVPRFGTAVIVRLDGTAEYQTPDGTGNIEEGMAFPQGQKIITGENGKIVSVLTPGCVLCVAPETTVDLQQIEMTTEGLPDASKRIDKNIVLDMPKGGALRFDGGGISPNLDLQVKTQAGNVLASGGRAIVAKDGALWRVICEDAFVTFDQNGKQKTVRQGEVLTASRNPDTGKFDTTTQPLEVAGLNDEFVGGRRAAERLAPMVFDVDYVHIGDLADASGFADVAQREVYVRDVSASQRKPNVQATSMPAIEDRGQLGRDIVWGWFGDVGLIKGVNYVPRTAVNSTEMWQEDTFDLDTIDEELGWAKKSGYTSMRFFLPFIVWQDDADGLKERMRDTLAKCRKHGLRAVFVLFDDTKTSGKEPYLGKQDEPVPGLHNSGWTPSPGHSLVTDKEKWAQLEEYVRDIVGSFKRDRRILFWDVYNEPGRDGMDEKSLPLVEAAFEWARDENPVQPLTCGIWSDMSSRMSKTLMEMSDVVSFKAHENENDLQSKLLLCQTLGRPLICTEWLRREKGNTFEKILPVFAEQHIGWFHWGLVRGKTQTYLPFDSKKGEKPDEVWQFDVLDEDGEPYDKEEVRLIRNFTFDE
jgi:hypothetical protein